MNLAKPLELFIDSIGKGRQLHPLVVTKPATRGNKGFVDVDRFPKDNPYQCVDLVDAWVLVLGGPNPVGNAIDYAGKTYDGWFKWLPLGRSTPLPGDLVVFDVGEYGHIAIVRKVLSGGRIECWSQNDPLRSGVIAKTYTTRNVVGYLRPKGSTPPTPMPYSDAQYNAQRTVSQRMAYAVATQAGYRYHGKLLPDKVRRQFVNYASPDKIVAAVKKLKV